MDTPAIVIRVDFPGLENLVQWLIEHDQSQATIDAMEAAITALTQRLQTSQEALSGAITTQEEQ